jgi:two-component system sporulation sensor kinase C
MRSGDKILAFGLQISDEFVMWWESNWYWVIFIAIGVFFIVLGLIWVLNSLQRSVNKKTQQLQESQYVLLQKDRLAHIGQISSSIANEINNPLTTLINAVDFLKEDLKNNPNKAEEDLTLLSENANRITQIVKYLMHYGQSSLIEFSPVDLNEILERALRINEVLIHQSKITIQLELAPDLPKVSGDDSRLIHVMIHLLTNAVDALNLKYPNPANGKKRIIIKSWADERTVNMSFKDFGVGISDKNKDLIFKPFFTTKETSPHVYGGTGLGLNICSRIMAEHQASIKVTSEEHEWTEVVLKFKKPV